HPCRAGSQLPSARPQDPAKAPPTTRRSAFQCPQKSPLDDQAYSFSLPVLTLPPKSSMSTSASARRIHGRILGKLDRRCKHVILYAGQPSQHWRVMNRLISSGDEKTMDARSPIIPAFTIAGASLSGPSPLESVLKRRLRSQKSRVFPSTVVTLNVSWQ